MQITMARGDMLTKSFAVKTTGGTAFTDPFDNIYFTVKKHADNTEYLLQKRLSDGGIESVGSGVYQFTIEPGDTDQMGFGDYDFDIELVINGILKKTFTGKFTLMKEVTHLCNEVIGT